MAKPGPKLKAPHLRKISVSISMPQYMLSGFRTESWQQGVSLSAVIVNRLKAPKPEANSPEAGLHYVDSEAELDSILAGWGTPNEESK